MGSAQGAAEDGSVGSLAELSRALADTRTVDDVARATLDAAMALPGTVRAGIAVSEGAEATQPFRPDLKPVDAYASAILDEVNL